MKRIYHLSSCSTCQRILKELPLDASIELIDIKEQNIPADVLDWLKDKVGSYEALFSKRAMKYKSMDIANKVKEDKDYRQYMLDEYTFLKRPFVILGEEIFIGNASKTVAECKACMA